jgi:hypothetical protein
MIPLFPLVGVYSNLTLKVDALPAEYGAVDV